MYAGVLCTQQVQAHPGLISALLRDTEEAYALPASSLPLLKSTPSCGPGPGGRESTYPASNAPNCLAPTFASLLFVPWTVPKTLIIIIISGSK